jgi:hypothetical protein
MRLPASIKLTAVAIGVCLAIACNRRPEPIDAEPAGEPERFSATIFSTVSDAADDGVERELSVTRIFKSDNLRREEWTEQDESRALIWRPDLGKSYLLDIGRRCYIETDLTPNDALKAASEPTARPTPLPESESADRSSASVKGDPVKGDAVDRAFDDSPAPVRVEARSLPDQSIDGHPCAVLERRAIFAGDYVEVTVTFRARDLNGLAIRVETGPGIGAKGSKLITRWKDIYRDVPADVFTVPPDFRRVDKLP